MTAQNASYNIHLPSSSSTSSETNFIVPIGYRFQPSDDDIFKYFLPRRLLGQPVNVDDIELYGDKSPDDLFGSSDENDFYFFTTLKKKKKSHNRVLRTAGGGTWHGQRSTEHNFYIDNKLTNIGTKRLYNFKGHGKNTWIMHEYSVDNTYINFMRHGSNVYANNSSKLPNLNPDDIVFCHVYNKTKREYEARNDRGEAYHLHPCKKQKTIEENIEDNFVNINNGFINVDLSVVEEQTPNTVITYNDVDYLSVVEEQASNTVSAYNDVQEQVYVPQFEAFTGIDDGDNIDMQEFLMQNLDICSVLFEEDSHDVNLQSFMNTTEGCNREAPQHEVAFSETETSNTGVQEVLQGSVAQNNDTEEDLWSCFLTPEDNAGEQHDAIRLEDLEGYLLLTDDDWNFLGDQPFDATAMAQIQTEPLVRWDEFLNSGVEC